MITDNLTKKRMFKGYLLLCFILTLISCSINYGLRVPLPPESTYAEDQKVRPLFKDGLYANPFPSVRDSINFREARKAMTSDKGVTVPTVELPVQKVDIKKAFPDGKDGIFITWLGHSTVLMQVDGVRILIDPVFSNNVSPVPFIGVKRFNKTKLISVNDLPYIDIVFLSHNHYDHLEKRTIKKLKSKVGFYITSSGVGGMLRGWGIDGAKIREHSWWEEGNFLTRNGVEIKYACTPARHFSTRTLTDRNRTLWASWVIKTPNQKLFYSGDTSYAPHFKQIGYHYGPFDVAIIENGQYNIHWPDSHIFPEDAVQACLDVKSKVMLPVHWGAFSLSRHDWWEPVTRTLKAAEEQDLNVVTPKIGLTIKIEDDLQTDRWWIQAMEEELRKLEISK